MSRHLAAALVAAFFFSGLSCGSAAAIEAMTARELIMRIGPSLEHRSVATVPAQADVAVHGCIQAERWCLVRFAGRRGWVAGEALDVRGFSRPPAAQRALIASAPSIVFVPVPVGPVVSRPDAVSAEEVIVGVNERTGRAAFASFSGRKVVILAQPRGGALVFKRPGKKHGFHPGHPKKPGHVDFAKRGKSPGKHSLSMPRFSGFSLKGGWKP